VSHAAWNGGKMDSWLPASYQLVTGNQQDIPLLIGYFEEEDLPFHRALADAFTICDRYHCSMLGPTSPNRLIWESGTIDPNGTAGGPILGDENAVKTWKTYAECLTDAGVSWKLYQVPGGMTSATKQFKAYQDAPASSPLYQNSQVVPVGQFEYDALSDRPALFSDDAIGLPGQRSGDRLAR
jgi:phospholipase C